MQKFDSNVLMIVLLALIGILFILTQILTIPISSTGVILSFILLFSIIVIIHGSKTLGARELVVFFFIAYSIPLLYEYTDALGFGGLVGVTCQYSTLLGPKFFGKVPYVIPLVWSIFLYCSFTMTNIIFNRLRTTPKSDETVSLQWFLKIVGMGIIAGLIMASLDLIIDPVMVAMGAWSWSGEGLYYGIPLWNYEGWIEITTVTFVFYSIYLQIIQKNQIYIGGEKRSRYTLFVVVLYLASFIVFGMYAVDERVTYVIPWAVMTMGLFAVMVIIQFYRSYMKGGKEVFSSVE
ncbi:MAG: carotenoid biosynthesis protein [Euryarchaeota archaeon]|jgi:putative membrane protein|nr:carotenoid biosynthesis protein [Euryarchaeota archaeon]